MVRDMTPRLFRTRSNLPVSRLCTQSALQSEAYQRICKQLKESTTRVHRKIWEFCFVADVLQSLGLVSPGHRGLGFAVGKEPMPAWFASHGCEIVASDMDPDAAVDAGWTETNQHAAQLTDLNDRAICEPDAFAERVRFHVVDMNHIPDDLRDFDFTWSCCAFEHLGSIEQGIQFIENQLKTLKPGGIAVHTTEYNLTSNGKTLDRGGTVLFRKRDFQALAKRLRKAGHQIELDYNAGDMPADRYVDVPPYTSDTHLKLQIEQWVCTSIGLVIKKAGAPE